MTESTDPIEIVRSISDEYSLRGLLVGAVTGRIDDPGSLAAWKRIEALLDAARGGQIEWARQPDCAAEGCDPPHTDADRVYPWSTDAPHPSTFAEPPQLNRSAPHAIRWVRRTAVATPWEPADPKEGRYAESD